MRFSLAAIVLSLGWVCLAADTPNLSLPVACSDAAGAPACKGASKDLKSARQAFSRGLKLQHTNKLDEAFSEFEEASRLVPQNVEYLTAREMVGQQLVASLIERGSDNLTKGNQVEALAEFRQALQLDSKNEFAQQRLRDALGPATVKQVGTPQLIASADAIAAQPKDERHDF